MGFFLVFSIAIFVSLLNIAHVFNGALKTPPGHIYLWTGHYYRDYFVYLQAMAQGARGRWLVENPFATDDYTQTILGYWPDLMIGKLGGLFNLPPIVTYWFSVTFFSFLLVFLIFLTVRALLPQKSFYIQLAAFLFTVFATSFFYIRDNRVIPYNAWYAPTHFFARLGGVPRHILDQILALLVILILADTLVKIGKCPLRQIFLRGLVLGLILSLLLTFSFLTINLSGAVFLTGLILLLKSLATDKKNFWLYLFLLALILFLVLPVGLLVKRLHNYSGVMVRSREAGVLQQVEMPFSFFLFLLGPIILFCPFGLVSFFRSRSVLRMLIFSLFIVSVVFFYSPLGFYLGDTNMRFLTPLIYIFLGVLAILGIEQSASLVKPAFRKGTVVALTSFLLLLFLPANINFFQAHMADPNFSYRSYLPSQIYEGFLVLNSDSDKRAVLTSPTGDLGLILPVFVDKRVYLGRPLFTPGFDEKQVLASRFYEGRMSLEEGRGFLAKNGISFVVWSFWDGRLDPLAKYDFLKQIFKNNLMVIFKHET